MAKRTAQSHLSSGEMTAGWVFFAVYLAVLPFAAAPLLELLERGLGEEIPKRLENALYYYLLFAVTVVIFHGFLLRTTRQFLDSLGQSVKAAALGLVVLYGLNELAYRLTHVLVDGRTNLNDSAVSAQIRAAPRVTLLIVIFLAPFVEEVLFRGLVFGTLRTKSRGLAYLVSCLLFALLHVWQFAVESRDASYFFLMVQYLVPGAVLSWAYERTGTLWTSILLHAAANGLSVWAAM